MLQVKTKLGVSEIAGIGLFADQHIPKGTIVWEYTPNLDLIFSEEEYNAFPELQKSFFKTYCFKYNNSYCFCSDNARFFNHSEQANCYSADFSATSLGCTRALRDIQIGEELTDNYAGFGFTSEDSEFNLDIF